MRNGGKGGPPFSDPTAFHWSLPFSLQVSNVTGENLDYLKMFMNLLSSRSPNTDECPAEFQIDDTYSVPGVGTVVSGTNLKVRFFNPL